MLVQNGECEKSVKTGVWFQMCMMAKITEVPNYLGKEGDSKVSAQRCIRNS